MLTRINVYLKVFAASTQDQPMHLQMATFSCQRDIHKLLTLQEQIEHGNHHAIMLWPTDMDAIVDHFTRAKQTNKKPTQTIKIKMKCSERGHQERTMQNANIQRLFNTYLHQQIFLFKFKIEKAAWRRIIELKEIAILRRNDQIH